jgi:hypothetical protein
VAFWMTRGCGVDGRAAPSRLRSLAKPGLLASRQRGLCQAVRLRGLRIELNPERDVVGAEAGGGERMLHVEG